MTNTRYLKQDDVIGNESRAVMALLGCAGGIREFSKRSSINHFTVAEIFGTLPLKSKKRHYVLVQFHAALHTAYEFERENICQTARAFILDWVVRWRKRAEKELLWTTSALRVGATEYANQRDKKRAGVKKAFRLAMKSLEWK